MTDGVSSRKTTVLAVAGGGIAVVLLGVVAALFSHTRGSARPVEPSVGSVEPFSADGVPPDGHAEASFRRQGGSKPLWRVVDEGAVQDTPPFSESWSNVGRVLVDVTATASLANAWRVGDRLAFELPQLGGVHEWTVEQIVEGWDARSRSVRGWVDNGEDRPRRIVVTVGPNRVLAYIDTPQGSYELTGNARLGWLLPSSSMMAGFDFSKPDYVLPNGHGDDHDHP